MKIIFNINRTNNLAIRTKYHDILGVSKNANDDEIKTAYYELAKKYHPDNNKDDKLAEKKFQEIKISYEAIINKEISIDTPKKKNHVKSKVRQNNSQSEYYHPSRRKVNSEQVIPWSPIDQNILDEIFLKSHSTIEIHTLENRKVGKIKVVRYDEFSNSIPDAVLQRMLTKVTIIFVVFFFCIRYFLQSSSSEINHTYQ